MKRTFLAFMVLSICAISGYMRLVTNQKSFNQYFVLEERNTSYYAKGTSINSRFATSQNIVGNVDVSTIKDERGKCRQCFIAGSASEENEHYSASDIKVYSYPMPPKLTNQQKNDLNIALNRAQKEKRIILEWYSRGDKNVTLQGVCGWCEITSNRTLINDSRTKAVVFMYRDIHSFSMPSPKTRRNDQLHVWQTGEAPPSLLLLHRRYFHYEEKYLFNMTASFRRDADIYHPYGSAYGELLKKIKLKYHKNSSKILEHKTKIAISVISNCHSMPGSNIRLQFVRDLIADGLKVDTYGRCFDNDTFRKSDKRNFNKLLSQYKFFLSFENSYHCRDYITEKFFANGFNAGAIPIVWGAAKEDYINIAPENSFIYADDFNTTKDLIDYVNYLNSNDSAFLEYFKWYHMAPEEMPDYGRQIRYCQLCRVIHGINIDDIFHPDYNSSRPLRPLISNGIVHRTVKSLINWYYKKERGECLRSSSRFYRSNESLAARTLDGRT